MSKITIDLTEEQERFLKEFAAKQYPGSEDNNITETPIHLVQTQRTRVINPEYEDADIIKYVVSDWDADFDSPEELVEAYYEDEECAVDIVPYDKAYAMEKFIDIKGEEQIITDEEDYFEAYGIDSDFYDKLHLKYYYDNVAVFFILDEAKKYMKYQRHNLENPRTYTIGKGYGNCGEYQHFWKLLFDLGKQLNESVEG